ncbi:MAG: hypothetical protein MHPSP_002408 [Paramarteilia canceri]
MIIDNIHPKTEVNSKEEILTFVDDVILPQLLWKKGRTYSSLRLSASIAFFKLMQLTRIQYKSEIYHRIRSQINSLLDDDNFNVQFVAICILNILEMDKEIETSSLHSIIRAVDCGNDYASNYFVDFLKKYFGNNQDSYKILKDKFYSIFTAFKI